MTVWGIAGGGVLLLFLTAFTIKSYVFENQFNNLKVLIMQGNFYNVKSASGAFRNLTTIISCLCL